MARSHLVLSLTAASVLVLSSPVRGQGTSCLRVNEADLVEEWRYQPPESAPAAQLLGRPEWAARAPDGNVFVLDRQNNRVVRLDARGRFAGSFGRRGQGPAELLTPVSVRVAPDGSIAVLDEGQSSVAFFSVDGTLRRRVRLSTPVLNARDFLVLADGRMAVTGTAAGSTHVVHVYDRAGAYVRGYGSLRMDLEEPMLRQRFSDGVLAELPGGALAHGQRTPFRLQVFRGTSVVLDRTEPRVVPDYARQAAQRVGEGWKFTWRHPSLTTLLPTGNGCFLAAVQRIPADERAGIADFRTVLYTLDASGRVAGETPLSRFFWGTQLWRDASGVHLLGFGMDRDTEVLYPVQYRVRSR